ncbi:MAG: EAL domain-containing protein [Gammaproteobacteria bacterium]|nr:EAL domain-containing protein [Gammaproteobacteria bacterium]
MVRIESGGSTSGDYQDRIRKTPSQEGVHLRCHRVAPLVAEQRNRAHFEVLLGIRDDAGEPVPAAQFVRAAEHFGHMPAVDRWVIRSMLNWMREHRRWLRRVGGFAINLSGASLSDPHLVEYVLELLGQSRVPPGKIVFEVTEAVAVDNMNQTQNFLRTLSEMGCRFALDGFGSGQSSYSSLERLPVDYVKIDGIFVRDIER